MTGITGSDKTLLRDQHNPLTVTPAQFRIHGVEHRIGLFSQSYVDRVIGRKVVPQLPNASQQRRVRISLRGEIRNSAQELLAAMRIDTVPGRKIPEGAHNIDIEQVRDGKRIASEGKIASQGVSHRPVREQLHHD